ncbi:uncharacterized protein BDV17DRAFT_248262 [Aspergillus undulatus]|uniref:uncharacterized protein n=1 Tax=Aspergillus undulatus TaxID=1810928 RepID=UPI003CCE1EF4
MAPRRGGGSYGGGGSSVSCSSSAFSLERERIQIAFHALYFIVSLVLLVVARRRINLNKKQGQPIVAAFTLSLSILLAMLYYLDSIVYIVIGQCGSVGIFEYYPAIIVANWLYMLSEYILVAVILTSICRKLQNDFGRVEQLILTLQTAWAGILGVFVVTSLSISTAMTVYSWSDELYDSAKRRDLALPLRGIRTTYLVLSVVGILLASATMAKSLFHAPVSLRSKNITIWVVSLIGCALGLTLTEMGGYVDFNFIYDPYAISSDADAQSWLDKQHALFFLASFFLAATFYAALKVAAYRVLPTHTATVISQAGPSPAYPSHPPMASPNGYSHQVPNNSQSYNTYQAGGYQPSQNYSYPAR